MYSQQIAAGARQMGLALNEQVFQQLGTYVSLLDKWNKAYNLTAIRHPEDMVSRHILDSLGVFPVLEKLPANQVIDVGTGPGLPGIPLALCFPDRHFTLLDSNSKKTRFLNQCKMELGLDNVYIVHSRAENFTPERGFDVVVSRAFTALSNMVKWCDHLLADEGVYVAMKGLYPEEEIKEISDSHRIVEISELHIPDTEGARHLIVFARGQ